MDPSSRWAIVLRVDEKEPDPYRNVAVWRADLETGELILVRSGTIQVLGMAVSPDQKYFYCIRNGSDRSFDILRIDICSLEETAVTFEGDARLLRSLGSVGPDNRTFVASAWLGGQRYGILNFDLEEGARSLIHEGGSDICYSHPQLEPGRGLDILLQHNRGSRYDDAGRAIQIFGEAGPSLYLIDRYGGNRRELPVGKPFTWPVQGHQCWIGRSGQVLFTTVDMDFKELRAKGNLMEVRAGDSRARVVARGRLFWHMNASRDGRFFAADTLSRELWDGPRDEVLIIVGSLKTGETSVLTATGARPGAAQHSHPHPYFSPDCRWVIFNSNKSRASHVYAAGVPNGLLDELDSD
jgi:hypothetical protein